MYLGWAEGEHTRILMHKRSLLIGLGTHVCLIEHIDCMATNLINWDICGLPSYRVFVVKVIHRAIFAFIIRFRVNDMITWQSHSHPLFVRIAFVYITISSTLSWSAVSIEEYILINAKHFVYTIIQLDGPYIEEGWTHKHIAYKSILWEAQRCYAKSRHYIATIMVWNSQL